MTLGRKLTLTIGAHLLGVVVLVSVGLWGLANLQTALEQTTDQFGAMREASRVGHHLTLARLFAQAKPTNLAAARQQIDSALNVMQEYESTAPADLRAGANPERRGLLDTLHQASRQTDPRQLASRATIGIAGAQRLAQRIQSDVRGRRLTALAMNRRAMINVSIVGGLIILLSALVGVAQRRSVMRPLRALQRGVDRLRRSDFSGCVQSAGDTEFRQLAQRFNEMAHALQRSHETLEERVAQRTSQLIRSERLARLGVLAAGFAHEVNNPLAIISAHAELALRHWSADSPAPGRDESAREMADALAIALDEVDRSQRIVARLARLGANETSMRTPISMRDVIQTALRLVDPIAKRAGVNIHCECPNDPDATRTIGDEGELVQIIINLLLNAIDATQHVDSQQSVSSVVRVTCWRGAAGVVAQIADTGRGMSPLELDRAFDPFVSGTGSTGLGLAVCQAIADRHGARLAARSDGPGAGSVFSLCLPAGATEAAA